MEIFNKLPSHASQILGLLVVNYWYSIGLMHGSDTLYEGASVLEGLCPGRYA